MSEERRKKALQVVLLTLKTICALLRFTFTAICDNSGTSKGQKEFLGAEPQHTHTHTHTIQQSTSLTHNTNSSHPPFRTESKLKHHPRKWLLRHGLPSPYSTRNCNILLLCINSIVSYDAYHQAAQNQHKNPGWWARDAESGDINQFKTVLRNLKIP